MAAKPPNANKTKAQCCHTSLHNHGRLPAYTASLLARQESSDFFEPLLPMLAGRKSPGVYYWVRGPVTPAIPPGSRVPLTRFQVPNPAPPSISAPQCQRRGKTRHLPFLEGRNIS